MGRLVWTLVAFKGLVVVVVLTMTRPDALEVGDVVGNLLDVFDLVVEECTLKEIGHLCVVVVAVTKTNINPFIIGLI